MAKSDKDFMAALTGKQIPILTLDSKWYKLFDKDGIPEEIKTQSERVNELMKKQGKMNSEAKKIKALKKKLLDEIMELADVAESGDKNSSKKMTENKRLVADCNKRLEDQEDEALDIANLIAQENKKLMILTMENCYSRLQQGAAEIEEIGKWIDHVRIELKKNLIRKQEREIITHNLYSYMHDIFGSEVMELFDMEYVPKELTKGQPGDKTAETKGSNG